MQIIECVCDSIRTKGAIHELSFYLDMTHTKTCVVKVTHAYEVCFACMSSAHIGHRCSSFKDVISYFIEGGN